MLLSKVIRVGDRETLTLRNFRFGQNFFKLLQSYIYFIPRPIEQSHEHRPLCKNPIKIRS